MVSPVSFPSSHPQNASTLCSHFPFVGNFNYLFFWHYEHCHCEQPLLEMSHGFHHLKLQTLSYSGLREFCAALALAFTTPKPRLLSNAGDLVPTDTPSPLFSTLPGTGGLMSKDIALLWEASASLNVYNRRQGHFTVEDSLLVVRSFLSFQCVLRFSRLTFQKSTQIRQRGI